MLKFVPAALAFLMAAVPALAAPPVPTATIPDAGPPTSAPAAMLPNNPPPVASVTPPPPITAELNDGSKVEIDADNTVWVLEPGGGKSEAPDGTLTLKDGTPFVVKEGKRVPGDE